MSGAKLDILGLSGSLRSGSINMALLRAAQAAAPGDVAIEIYDYSDVPLYNGDVEAAGFPAAATRLKERVARADAILFAVPEYNYSFPGVLKNAIDWASRPYGKSAWHGKPAAMMGGGGGQGTSRAQYQLRQVLSGLDMHLLSKPEIFVANGPGKFDADNKFADTVGLDLVGKLVLALRDWTLRLKR